MQPSRNIAGVFQEIFSQWSYIIFASVVAVMVVILSIWLPNLGLIKSIIFSSTFTLSQKIGILWGSLRAYQTNLTSFGRVALVVIASLFAMNLSLLIFYLRKRAMLESSAAVSLVGVLSGILGIGCASCGSILLSSLLGAATTAAFVGYLPLRGEEFSILGIIILGISIVLVAKKINKPLICK